MLYKDIKAKDAKEIQKLLADLKAELFTLHFKNVTGSLDQSHKIKLVRTDIAKCYTALKEKELEANKGAK